MKILLKIIFMPILGFAAYTSVMNGFVYEKYDDLLGGFALALLLIFWIYRSVVPKRKHYQQ